MRNILITGGAGGIASQLEQQLLSMGHKVVSVDNLHNGYKENLSVANYEISVTDPRIQTVMLSHQIDCVIHMAAISSLPECEESPMDCYNTNTLGTLNVLESARKCGIKDVIFTSTSAVYENNSIYPFREDMVVAPTLNYCLSKKLAEEICHSYTEKFGMNITVLRLFNVFGPRQDIYRKSPPLINYIVKEIMVGRAPTLHSDGEQRRDYISVYKVCEVIIHLVQNGVKSGVYNVCSGKTYSVNEIYEAISKAFNFSKPATFNKAEALWKDYNISLDKKIVAKETNKYSHGDPTYAARELGMSFIEDTLNLIAATAVVISNIYASKHEKM